MKGNLTVPLSKGKIMNEKYLIAIRKLSIELTKTMEIGRIYDILIEAKIAPDEAVELLSDASRSGYVVVPFDVDDLLNGEDGDLLRKEINK